MTPRTVPGALGSDAVSKGDADKNESTPADQRVPDRKTDLDDGPKVDPKTGNYMPARYRTIPRGGAKEGNIREDR